MKSTILCAIGLLIQAFAASAGAATAAPYHALGFGSDQCGQYVEAHRQGQQGYAPYISFVQGYATAMSANTAVVEARTVDYTSNASIEAMAVWLNNYCTQHPLTAFAVATEAFLESASGIPSRLPYLEK
jgi:hypothetical protein